MSADGEVVTVAAISGKLDSQYSLASDIVLIAPSQKLSCLASKHASHDQLNSAFLNWSLWYLSELWRLLSVSRYLLGGWTAHAS